MVECAIRLEKLQSTNVGRDWLCHGYGYGYVSMVVFPTNIMTLFTTVTSRWETNTWAGGLRSRSLLNNKHAHHVSYLNHSHPHSEKKNPTTR